MKKDLITSMLVATSIVIIDSGTVCYKSRRLGLLEHLSLLVKMMNQRMKFMFG